MFLSYYQLSAWFKMNKIKKGNTMKNIIVFVTLLFAIPFLSGCWYAAAAGVGAYGGYKAKEKGYKTQSPITKEKQVDRKEEEKQ